MRGTDKRVSALKDRARLQGFGLERTNRGWRVTDLSTRAVVCDRYSLAEVEGFLGMSAAASTTSTTRARRRRV